VKKKAKAKNISTCSSHRKHIVLLSGGTLNVKLLGGITIE